jgi:hypothetical protein
VLEESTTSIFLSKFRRKECRGDVEIYPSVLITNEQDVISFGRSTELEDLLFDVSITKKIRTFHLFD